MFIQWVVAVVLGVVAVVLDVAAVRHTVVVVVVRHTVVVKHTAVAINTAAACNIAAAHTAYTVVAVNTGHIPIAEHSFPWQVS